MSESKPNELQKRLVENLAGSELQSLLIRVFTERAITITPAEVLQSWLRDRFVRPSSISPRERAALELAAFDAAEGFIPVELSPVCPLGTNTSVAPMSQNKVLATIRNTEVVADSTNVMALECSVRRRELLRRDPKSPTPIKLCSMHRLIRTQKFSDPKALAHFGVFGLCTAGRDSGNWEFELSALVEHVGVYGRLLQALASCGSKIGRTTIHLYGEDKTLITRATEVLSSSVDLVQHQGRRKSAYYPSISFKMYVQTPAGADLEIGDGGITDWTQKFLTNAKERLMISGVGTDRLLMEFK